MSSSNPLLLPIKYDTDTIHQKVLTTIVKMLSARKWLKLENLEENITNLTKQKSDDLIYKLKIDVNLSDVPFYLDENEKLPDSFNNNIVIIKFIQQKIIGINKSSIITDFISDYKNNHKILVVESISDKAKSQLYTLHHVEIFDEAFLMFNLLEHELSPQYEILTKEQIKEFKDSFNIPENKMKRILDTDKASRYFNLKRRQIIRIIRNSEITGKSVDYRIVVRSQKHNI
jgi:DNA-directed RNA polymerase subunit H (RpoH/RPB5)